jgi:hypothetical protein
MQTAVVADERVDRLVSFRTFLKAAEEGANIPPVSKGDLKRLHNAWTGMTKRYCGKDGAMSLELMARACDPVANLPAVWLRYTRFRSLVRHGVLAAWQQSTGFEDVVYEVAATIPMKGFRLDEEAFVRRLREEDD